MASASGTLYTGVTNNIHRRVLEHRAGKNNGFTSRYNITKLWYLEETDDISAALEREKQIKGWRRSKKIELIRSLNPTLKDMSKEWLQE
ncbi:MAG: GIY-YIG nuclease family protein [Chloroflexi bacterium]|nr:GIY-YIG nuclease family protein [Chloroflexota bacterium]